MIGVWGFGINLYMTLVSVIPGYYDTFFVMLFK